MKSLLLSFISFLSFMSLWAWNQEFDFRWPLRIYLELSLIGVGLCIVSLILSYRFRRFSGLSSVVFSVSLGGLMGLFCAFFSGRAEGFLILSLIMSFCSLLSQLSLYLMNRTSFQPKRKKIFLSVILSLVFYALIRSILMSLSIEIPSLTGLAGIALIWAAFVSLISLQFHYTDLRALERALQIKPKTQNEFLIATGLAIGWIWPPLGTAKLLTQARR